MGHSFLEVWGVTLSDFHHFPIFICGADAPRTGGSSVSERCRSGFGAALTHRARGDFGVGAALTHRARGEFGVGAVSERCRSGADAPRTGEFGVGTVSERCRSGADAPRTGGVRCRSGVRAVSERC